jgi:hypothetical protein
MRVLCAADEDELMASTWEIVLSKRVERGMPESFQALQLILR